MYVLPWFSPIMRSFSDLLAYICAHWPFKGDINCQNIAHYTRSRIRDNLTKWRFGWQILASKKFVVKVILKEALNVSLPDPNYMLPIPDPNYMLPMKLFSILVPVVLQAVSIRAVHWAWARLCYWRDQPKNFLLIKANWVLYASISGSWCDQGLEVFPDSQQLLPLVVSESPMRSWDFAWIARRISIQSPRF